MEQNNQQITQRPALPTKTKVAAWWMIIIGGFYVYYFFNLILSFFLPSRIPSPVELPIPPDELFLSSLRYHLPGVFAFFIPGLLILFLRKRWVWIFVVAMFTAAGIFDFVLNNRLAIYMLSFPPFFLLLLDCRNFWKIAR